MIIIREKRVSEARMTIPEEGESISISGVNDVLNFIKLLQKEKGHCTVYFYYDTIKKNEWIGVGQTRENDISKVGDYLMLNDDGRVTSFTTAIPGKVLKGKKLVAQKYREYVIELSSRARLKIS
jgi:hypothetical protein